VPELPLSDCAPEHEPPDDGATGTAVGAAVTGAAVGVPVGAAVGVTVVGAAVGVAVTGAAVDPGAGAGVLREETEEGEGAAVYAPVQRGRPDTVGAWPPFKQLLVSSCSKGGI